MNHLTFTTPVLALASQVSQILGLWGHQLQRKKNITMSFLKLKVLYNSNFCVASAPLALTL